MPDSRLRFLVVRLSSIGDIVHALPAVGALGETFPQAEIHWAVETCHADLLAGNPFVHRVWKLDTLGWRRRLGSAATVAEIGRSLLALRELSFDAAIDFQGLYKSGLIAWLSGARQRLGFAENWLREPGAGIFYTDRVAPRGREHVIEMNLALVERLGARAGPWQFPLPRTAQDDDYVEQQLAAGGAREFVVINPGGGWKSKCWPPEDYAELIPRLRSELLWKLFLTGSRAEEELIQDILCRACSSQASYFPATIAQLIALLRKARLFVGGDSGPLQLAAAVGTPLVAIFGPTDPTRNGPFSAADIALSNRGPIDYTRRAKNPTYISGISVDMVLAAVRERLARAHG